MRVTNSMLVNNLMRNLNNNFRKVDSLQNMMASGRKFGHISDDPVALIYSQAARNKLTRLSHYQRTVATAQDWIRQVEGGAMELQGRVADIYNELINAATDVKGDGDKNNVAMLVAQLRDHYVDALNATFGDKYLYAGYNTPGDSKTGKVTGPFTLDATWNLYYNGEPMSNFLQISIGGTEVPVEAVRGVFGGLNIDITGSTVITDVPPGVPIQNRVNTVINKITELLTTGIPGSPGPPPVDPIPGLDELNSQIKAQSDTIAAIRSEAGDFPTAVTVPPDVEAELTGLNISGLTSVIERLDAEIADLPDNYPQLAQLQEKRAIAHSVLISVQSRESSEQRNLGELRKQQEIILQELASYVNTDNPQFDAVGRVSLSVGGIQLLAINDGVTPPGNVSTIAPVAASYDVINEKIDYVNRLLSDVLTFDVGPAVSMQVTINGIDLALFQGSDGTTKNVFNVLHEVYLAASSGAPAEELTRLIRPLQDAQNHLLTKVAELGGRTRRLELLSARYEQDNINYEQMKSDAEDADIAEVIMKLRMAEAVMQASMSAGARIIQPSLMDFLR